MFPSTDNCDGPPPNFKCDNSCNDAAAAAAGDKPGVCTPPPSRNPGLGGRLLMELPRFAVDGGPGCMVSPP